MSKMQGSITLHSVKAVTITRVTDRPWPVSYLRITGEDGEEIEITLFSEAHLEPVVPPPLTDTDGIYSTVLTSASSTGKDETIEGDDDIPF